MKISGTAGAGNNVGNTQLQGIQTSYRTTTQLHSSHQSSSRSLSTSCFANIDRVQVRTEPLATQSDTATSHRGHRLRPLAPAQMKMQRRRFSPDAGRRAGNIQSLLLEQYEYRQFSTHHNTHVSTTVFFFFAK